MPCHRYVRPMAGELGATHTINASAVDIAAQVLEIAPRGVDYAFDTTANMQVISGLICSLTLGGKCGLITSLKMEESSPFPVNELFIKAGQLHGIFLGSSNPLVLIPQLIKFNRDGRFPYEQLIKEYDFQDINKAFEDCRNGRAIKPVLIMP